jgi:hypothetical protein
MLAPLAAAQEIQAACKNLSYESRNQIDYGPLRVAAVRGITKDAEGISVPRVCVGVFTEAEHKLIAAVEADEHGHFELKGIAEGNYRLVAKFDGFSPANAKLRIERSRNKKALIVQMRTVGIDSGSFVESK